MGRPQLSNAVGVVYATTALHWPASLLRTILAGQVMAGGVISVTVTVKEQVLVFALRSVAFHTLVLIPTGKVAPEARPLCNTTDCTPQLSVAVGVV